MPPSKQKSGGLKRSLLSRASPSGMEFESRPPVTFGALLAAEPLTVQEAPAEQGLAALQDWGGGFPGWGRGRGGRRGTVSAELQPYVRTSCAAPAAGGEFPPSWNCGFTCGSGSVGLRIALSLVWRWD